MRFSDVKERGLYFADFEPVRECEFNKKHLVVVLKKNNDKKTCVVIPLTTKPNGDMKNKIKVGLIENLPESLKHEETYAVFNQVRTLNVNRFICLKEGEEKVQAFIDIPLYEELLGKIITDLIFPLKEMEKVELLRHLYENECIKEIITLAYMVKNHKKSMEEFLEEVEEFLPLHSTIEVEDKEINEIIKKIEKH